jgi:hypothetical protein
LESLSSPPSPLQKNKRESYLQLPGLQRWNLRHHHCRKTREKVIYSFLVSGVGIPVYSAITTAEKQERKLFTAYWSPALESPSSPPSPLQVISSFIVTSVGISVLSTITTAGKQERKLFTVSWSPALESPSSPPSPLQKNKRESKLQLPGLRRWNLRPLRHHHCRKTRKKVIYSFLVSGVGISVLSAITTAEKQERKLFTAS